MSVGDVVVVVVRAQEGVESAHLVEDWDEHSLHLSRPHCVLVQLKDKRLHLFYGVS